MFGSIVGMSMFLALRVLGPMIEIDWVRMLFRFMLGGLWRVAVFMRVGMRMTVLGVGMGRFMAMRMAMSSLFLVMMVRNMDVKFRP
jgi:hypothetical protein